MLAIFAVVLSWSLWKWWEIRRYRQAMGAIQKEIESGLGGLAARDLAALLSWKPDSDEALYLLGKCELARGRAQAADTAWARVAPRSRFAPQAMAGRVQVQMELGRLADAEQLINNALKDPQIDGSLLRALLAPVYLPQGRLEEVLRLIEARWDALDRSGEGASDQAINLVRLHVDLRLTPSDDELNRAALEGAARAAAEDDRVWLARANQALGDGALDEASSWLDRCLERRPEDPAVWSARLNWALRTNRVALARQALTHLPAEASTPAQVQKLAAWFAAQRGDVATERRALERLSAADPADLVALDRLAEIAVKDSRPERALDVRRRKAEIEKAMARYEKLHKRRQPSRDAAELGRLAGELGQRFEAKAFLTLAVAVDPEREDLRHDLARLLARRDPLVAPGRTLAQVLAAEINEGNAR
jgi:tetratricopeptide (TPR) repeat protein